MNYEWGAIKTHLEVGNLVMYKTSSVRNIIIHATRTRGKPYAGKALAEISFTSERFAYTPFTV